MGRLGDAREVGSRGLEPGDLGPGSYGHAFHNFTTDLDGDDPGFDQLPHLIQKLRDLPLDRTALMSPWIPQANHREAGVQVAQHDRAVPRLDPRARASTTSCT